MSENSTDSVVKRRPGRPKKTNENVAKQSNNNQKKTKIGILSFIVIIILLGFFIYLRLMSVDEIDSISIPVVSFTHIEKGNITKENSVMGTIMPADTFYVINKVAGEITKIYVENGQEVKKGDKICDIDNSKQIEAARIQYDTAKNTFERMEKLYNAGDISKQNFEQVKAQYDAAKLQYDTQVEYSTPLATGDGIVENTNMTLNVSIDTKTTLCYITSNDAKEIQFGVTERVLGGIQIGDDVVVEKHGKTYAAMISDKSGLINPSTGLFNVKARITDENVFASGIMAKVTFTYERKNDADLLSRDLVYYDAGKPYVYVVDEENILHKKYIKTGIENMENIEILSGLTKNDKVVSTWHNDLAEGIEVELKDVKGE